jgi:hypothetical protein
MLARQPMMDSLLMIVSLAYRAESPFKVGAVARQ